MNAHMELQKTFRLTLSRLPGEALYLHQERQREVNHPTRKISQEKLLADLLKRLARSVMAGVTECPPDTIPAHLARLDDLRQIVDHVLRHELAEDAEARLSGAQLAAPCTLADYVAAMEITRRYHRAPAFVTYRDAALSEINHKLDLLAGLFSKSPALQAVIGEEEP